MSVTEQMVLHAQEFNVRIDQLEQLEILNHQEVTRYLLDILDRIEVLQIRIEELPIK